MWKLGIFRIELLWGRGDIIVEVELHGNLPGDETLCDELCPEPVIDQRAHALVRISGTLTNGLNSTLFEIEEYRYSYAAVGAVVTNDDIRHRADNPQRPAWTMIAN